MKIVFIDYGGFRYSTETPYREPLGGTESSICYLTEQLATAGHEIFIINSLDAPIESRGVKCIPREQIPESLLPSADAIVVVNYALGGPGLRQVVGDRKPIVLWNGHAHDQPAVAPLQDPDCRNAYNSIVLMSDWHRDSFIQTFAIEASRCRIIPHAMGPSFQDQFAPDGSILAHKPSPCVLAYTSTPFRGLERLLDMFPAIRAAVPGATLRVYSSMKVYQFDSPRDEADYGPLYRRCRDTEGIEYVGSLSQTELARELRSVTALTYTNTFPEAYCISVVEAMASGCIVITSDLAALPQTCAGFAHLIPMNGDSDEYSDLFVAAVIQSVSPRLDGDEQSLERHLAAQVAYVNRHDTWAVRAKDWIELLDDLVA